MQEKTITICGSMQFFDEIQQLKHALENAGWRVFTPIKEGGGIDYAQLTQDEQAEVKKGYIDEHVEKIKQSSAILVANYDKKGIPNYVGANTFLEMGFAYLLGKKIYLLQGMPEQGNTVEMRGMMPVVLEGDLAMIS